MSEISHHKARVGALSRSRPDDDPELQDARRKLRYASLARKVIADAPKLTDEQCQRIANLLLAGGAAQ